MLPHWCQSCQLLHWPALGDYLGGCLCPTCGRYPCYTPDPKDVSSLWQKHDAALREQAASKFESRFWMKKQSYMLEQINAVTEVRADVKDGKVTLRIWTKIRDDSGDEVFMPDFAAGVTLSASGMKRLNELVENLSLLL
jgi:hypothetical protein